MARLILVKVILLLTKLLPSIILFCNIITAREIFNRVKRELQEKRRRQQEAWEAPLVAYIIAGLCETLGALKDVIKEILRLEEAFPYTVEKMRSAFKGRLAQYKLQEALKILSEGFEVKEHYRYVKKAIMDPLAIFSRKKMIIADLKQITSKKKSKIETYAQQTSLHIFLVFFLPFILLYSSLLLGKLLLLPFITLIQLGSFYVARKKLFLEFK